MPEDEEVDAPLIHPPAFLLLPWIHVRLCDNDGMYPRHIRTLASVLVLSVTTLGAVLFAADDKKADKPEAKPLFPEKGKPKAWKPGLWSDVSQPAPQGTDWTVDDQGVLHCANE